MFFWVNRRRAEPVTAHTADLLWIISDKCAFKSYSYWLYQKVGNYLFGKGKQNQCLLLHIPTACLLSSFGFLCLIWGLILFSQMPKRNSWCSIAACQHLGRKAAWYSSVKYHLWGGTSIMTSLLILPLVVFIANWKIKKKLKGRFLLLETHKRPSYRTGEKAPPSPVFRIRIQGRFQRCLLSVLSQNSNLQLLNHTCVQPDLL